MLSCDTNILLHAYNKASPFNEKAMQFLITNAKNRSFLICELVLIELYILLRNPKVIENPLSSIKAVEICRKYRRNENWVVVDYPGNLMNRIWETASQPEFPRRSIFDVRLAFTLRYHGVIEFATRNTKHFASFGFQRVWDPLK